MPKDKTENVDLEAMTLDELNAYKGELFERKKALQDEVQAVQAVFIRKLKEQKAEAALARLGIEGVSISVPAAELKLEPNEVG